MSAKKRIIMINVFIVFLLHTFTPSDALGKFTFSHPASVDFFQGQTATIVCNVTLTSENGWKTVEFDRKKQIHHSLKYRIVQKEHGQPLKKLLSGRKNDTDLDVQGSHSIVATFTLRNLRTTDEMYYIIKVSDASPISTIYESSYFYLRVLVLPGIPTLTLQPDKAVYCSNINSVLNITLDAVVGQLNQTNFTLVENNVIIGMISGQRTGNWSKAVFTRQLSKPGTFVLSGKAMIGAYSTNSSKDITITVKVCEFTWHGNFNCTNCTWDDAMADKNSQKFKSFKSKWENILTKVYQNKKFVNRITVVKFSPGVVVSFELMLEANVSDPLSPLKEELRRNGGAVGGFTIDSKSISSGIYAREISASTTTARPMATTKSSYLTQGAIIGIAVGCSLLVVIAIAVIVIYCCCCKKVNGVI